MSEFDMKSGGKFAIERLMQAYGFKLKIELCKHLDIPSATLSTWLSRDYFPAASVIKCALETGVSLKWLVTGEGSPEKENVKTNLLTFDRSVLKDGALLQDGMFTVDNAFFPVEMTKPSLVFADTKRFLIEHDFNDLSNGLWLVDIEGEVNIRLLEKIPVKRVKVTNEDTAQFFECAIDDIKVLGKVVLTCK